MLSGEDTTSERVRFDDNVSFIDETVGEVNSVPFIPDQQQVTSRLLKVRAASRNGRVQECKIQNGTVTLP